MTTTDIIGLLSLIASTVLSIAVIIMTSLNAKVSKAMFQNQIQIQKGATELQILHEINETAKTVIDKRVDAAVKGSKRDALNNALYTAEENYLNVFEVACGLYDCGDNVNDKLDKKSFENLYKKAVIDLVENEKFKVHLKGAYETIWKVYAKWEQDKKKQ